LYRKLKHILYPKEIFNKFMDLTTFR